MTPCVAFLHREEGKNILTGNKFFSLKVDPLTEGGQFMFGTCFP